MCWQIELAQNCVHFGIMSNNTYNLYVKTNQLTTPPQKKNLYYFVVMPFKLCVYNDL